MSSKLEVMNRMMERLQKGDVEGFLDCFTDDVEYHWHVGSKPVVGKDKMRKFLANYGAAFEQVSCRILNHAEDETLLFVEGHEELRDLKHDRIIRQPFMQAYEFTGQRIAKMRDYYEPANLRPPADAA